MSADKPGAGRPRLDPFGGAAVALLAAGLLLWIWTGDWRPAATGAVLMVVLAVVAGARQRQSATCQQCGRPPTVVRGADDGGPSLDGTVDDPDLHR